MSGAARRREGRCVVCIQNDGRRSATPEALPVSHMIGEVRSCDQGGGAYKKWDRMTGRWDRVNMEMGSKGLCTLYTMDVHVIAAMFSVKYVLGKHAQIKNTITKLNYKILCRFVDCIF